MSKAFILKLQKKIVKVWNLNCYEPREKKVSSNVLSIYMYLKKVASENYDGKSKMILGPFLLLEYKLIFRFQQRYLATIFFLSFSKKKKLL